jgi:two-component system, NtrC family, sensor kinase
MGLRTRVLALIGCLFAVLGVAQYGVQQKVLLPGFVDLERDAARTDMERVAHAIRRELDLLLVTARDYGNWLDTYRFMQGDNPDYVSANMTSESLATLRINAIAFITPAGRYIFSAGRDLESGAALDIELLDNGTLPEGHPWRTRLRDGEATSGILSTSQGPMLAVLAPILDGTGAGPHRGMVLLGRLVTEQEIARIGEQAQVRLSRAASFPRNTPTPTQAEVLVAGDAFTEVFRQFSDVSGVPAMVLRIDVPRSISQRGADVVNYASVFLAATGTLVLLVMIMMLSRTLLGPLARVTRQAVAVGEGDDLSARINLDRRDEIGELAREFDRMVGRLAEARRQLIDQSFHAGIAENASGVLHNLGNAMTPLAVKLAGLQDALRAAPTGDIDLVLAEIKQNADDAGRRHELDEFLALTSRELACVLTAARKEIDNAARDANAIQEVLSHQTRQARADAVIETISLPDVVDQSLELVPPALQQVVAIQVDRSLAELGAVRVARTQLKQVFQNLIVNAAESIREAGRERGSLRISVAVLPADGGDRLQLSFADNGVGIASGDLPHVFDKGFSTKPAATNSGIGLHWSANTINALGGSIRAESPGPNRGATLYIVLPLERAVTASLKNVA